MDNFQTHVFTASQRLNDLTGYSGIEALKKEIERQETSVQASRKAVKDARTKYADTIATRSTTQREVNDLLHRKHTWSPTDLERFTSLYRSDHVNEQAEGAAQNAVSEAEARYEEASTKLAKTILARYHEEQIWSDKIRQMSTWGTWGLMGLNVLLFVVFQIAVEPWRRKRLVKGFEEKVELALKERDEDFFAAARSTIVQPNQAVPEELSEEKVEEVADNIVEQIVNAVSGTVEDTSTADMEVIDKPVEEMVSEQIIQTVPMETVSESTPSFWSFLSNRWVSSTSPFAPYEDSFRALFSVDRHVMLTQRELTTIAMEGVAGGMALMGVLFLLIRPK
jgi:sensitive to high expression protein 9